MGEPRRIELMPVSAPQNGKKEDKSTKTVRFQLSLTDSTSEACPEFSYAYLLQKRLVSTISLLHKFSLNTNESNESNIGMLFIQLFTLQLVCLRASTAHVWYTVWGKRGLISCWTEGHGYRWECSQNAQKMANMILTPCWTSPSGGVSLWGQRTSPTTSFSGATNVRRW